jgi:hypothetical protein
MINLVISLGVVGFLPVISYLRNLIIHHLDGGQSHRRRSGQSVALRPRVTLVATDGKLSDDRRILTSFTSHGDREMGAAQRAVNVKQ